MGGAWRCGLGWDCWLTAVLRRTQDGVLVVTQDDSGMTGRDFVAVRLGGFAAFVSFDAYGFSYAVGDEDFDFCAVQRLV